MLLHYDDAGDQYIAMRDKIERKSSAEREALPLQKQCDPLDLLR